jgi:hypothetical protein
VTDEKRQNDDVSFRKVASGFGGRPIDATFDINSGCVGELLQIVRDD